MEERTIDKSNSVGPLRQSSESVQDSHDTDRIARDETLEMDDYIHSDEEQDALTPAQLKKRKQHEMDGHLQRSDDMEHNAQRTERKRVNAAFIRETGINVLLIGLWYSFSISISVYNKWMFSKDNLDFHFPLFVTSIHMIVQFSLASTVLYFIPRFRPGADPAVNPHDPSYRQLDQHTEDTEPLTSDVELKPAAKKAPLMTKTFYATRIGPCGTATAFDIGLGNFSLRFISLTFFTMCKSSVLGFVLLFAFLFRLESPTWKLCVIILFMTVGVVMMVAGEAAFSALGFMLVMTASLCSGFRWSLTQILLLRNPATSNPFSSIFFLTPVMFLALFLLALPIEGPTNVVEGIKILAEGRGGFVSFVLLLFPGFLAFLMVSAEFALLKRTSVVTLSVCGIFKEVLTISAAGVIFGDELSPINVSGLVVTILSIAAYNVLKYTSKRIQMVQEVDAKLGPTGNPTDRVHHPAGSSTVADSTSALLRRDSEQFALAGDDDDDAHDLVHVESADHILESDRLGKAEHSR